MREGRYEDHMHASDEKYSMQNLLDTLWDCYVASGGDTDSDNEWHCSVQAACNTTLDAIKQLRQDYDELLTELEL